LVDFRSANPLIVGFPLPLDRPHVLTNKFENPGCPDYQKVAGKVQDFLHIIREASPLQQAEKWIYENHYSEAKLQIERVSGELLSMQQCYINLAMIEQPKVRIDRSDDNSERKEGTQKASPFSLSARLKVETPNEAIQVELNDIFRSREGASGRLIPRHILIRGRAGVGKTTLCKKIIFECTRNDMWKDLFDRVLWIPLRKLKALTEKVYNMESLFFFEYFSHDEDSGRTLAKALTKAVLDSRTLFVLDGLDEISSLLGQETPLSGFLTSLLNQTNIIVTSRPHVSLRSALVPDLELETIGFYLDQVNQYIEETFANRPEISNKIKSFLQDHALVQDLVRIPVQLDALCYTWDEGHEHTADLSTMTRIYRAIEQRLWRKDVLHLTKVHDGRAVTKSEVDSCGPQGIEAILALEISLVEELAFIGLHNDLIEFAPDIQQAAFSRLRRQLLPGKTLPYISFLRTSDLKSEASRSYHFLHLTYQEYFAARYFVRQWLASPSPTLVLNYNDRGGTGFTATRYLQKHKYTTRYNILWRFVAGLLAAEGRAKDFLDVIEDEPRDLLGPLHQRLVIHCLAEVANSSLSNSPVTNITLWQKVLEDHLIEWLIFEIENTDDCLLLREAQILPSVLVKTLQKLREKEFDTQFKLLDGIAKWQNASALTIEFLSSWLEDGGGPQYSVVVALGTNPVLSNSLVSHIAVRLQDDKSHMRIAALKTLGAQKTISEAILLQMGACLNDDEWTVRQQALKVLGSRAVLPEAILSQIISQLECEDEELRQTAVDALKVHAALAESVLSQIAARLGNDDFRVRQASVEVLGARADAPETILLQVVARLGDPHEDVRETTMNRLLCRKDLSTEISSQITALLRTSDATIQQRAAAILHKTTMMRPEVIRQQIAARLKGLARPETYIIRIAILLEARREFDLAAVIWELVPQSVPQEAVLEVIVAFLADSELRVQSAARLALARKAGLPKTILKQIAAYFGDKSDSVRLGALHLLRSSPRLPHAIVMHVLLFLGDKDDSIREAAGEVLFRQTDLSGCILEPHVRLIYTQALRISWERDICWLRDRTDPSRHYLQIESRLNHLRNWSPRMTAEIADIAAQLRVPRSKKSVSPVCIAIEWLN
jgi:hypothetical protein